MLEGKGNKANPRVANSKRSRELCAAAAIARLEKIQSKHITRTPIAGIHNGESVQEEYESEEDIEVIEPPPKDEDESMIFIKQEIEELLQDI